MDQFVKLTETGPLARLTLNRPPVNVLNIALLTQLNGHLETLSGRSDLCALLIDAEGKLFSAGVDVPEHKPETVREMIGTFHRTFRLMHQLPMPTICAVQGAAYGGAMELAIFCDILLAAADAKFGVPEITLGVFPPLAVAHLAKIVGLSQAAELIYTGSIIDAIEAHRIGMVNHVFPVAEFRASVDQFALKLTGLSAYSLRQTKTALRRATMPDFERALKDAETAYLDELMRGHDPTEGLTAFIEKRPPAWRHS